ncbi:hypothetical protein CAPI_08665 [Corynebacterium capitovis DSM 44611]|uniref:hypothetical protein n=1 Tax=Corynebacterium capitovis TaxID=131081 RepID=UPI0003802EE9|nr:hypothetical protein [Corynebacterium capitovis]WKD58259.1 hypothetical protein CAPI_08665 [Corynebacterium capitovis DSM 44611]
MNAPDTLQDLAARVRFSLAELPHLTGKRLAAHPGDHPNSVAWLLWHTGRELDIQLAVLSGGQEVWVSQGFRNQVALGELGDSMGYGHTPEQAHAVHVCDADVLLNYVSASLDAVSSYIGAVGEDAWDDTVDIFDGEPVSRQVRVTSTLLDALEHLAQVHYVAGMPAV